MCKTTCSKTFSESVKTLFNLKSCFYILELAHWKSEVRLIRSTVQLFRNASKLIWHLKKKYFSLFVDANLNI